MADLQELKRANLELFDAYEGLADSFDEADWRRPTGCPGWTVKDIVAHVIGVEAVHLGEAQPDHEPPGDLPHVRDDFGRYMEVHVDLRRPLAAEEVRRELHDVLERRRVAVAGVRELGEEVPTVFARTAPAAQVLSIRVLDLWMHEQDLRRAVGRPGHRTGPAADVSLRRIDRAVARALHERLPGLTGPVVLDVLGDAGSHTVAFDLATGDPLAEPPADPTVRVELDVDAYVSLAGGRADAPSVAELVLQGDRELGQRVLSNLAITP